MGDADGFGVVGSLTGEEVGLEDGIGVGNTWSTTTTLPVLPLSDGAPATNVPSSDKASWYCKRVFMKKKSKLLCEKHKIIEHCKSMS